MNDGFIVSIASGNTPFADLLRWQYNPLHNGRNYSHERRREAPTRRNKRNLRAKSMIETRTNGDFWLKKKHRKHPIFRYWRSVASVSCIFQAFPLGFPFNFYAKYLILACSFHFRRLVKCYSCSGQGFYERQSIFSSVFAPKDALSFAFSSNGNAREYSHRTSLL